MKTKLIMFALLAMQGACSGGSGADANANDSTTTTTTTTSEIAKTDVGNKAAPTNTGTVIANNDIHNVFATSSNAASESAVSSSVTTSTAPSNATVVTDVTTTTQAVLKPLTEKEKIDALEKLGKLPTLDRSDSLLGPDLDKNGIRDDIDAYIMSQNFTEPQKKAAQQIARAFANILLTDTSNSVLLKLSDSILGKSINCLYARFKNNSQISHLIGENIEKMTVNTRIRINRYVKYQVAMNGEILHSEDGDNCE